MEPFCITSTSPFCSRINMRLVSPGALIAKSGAAKPVATVSRLMVMLPFGIDGNTSACPWAVDVKASVSAKMSPRNGDFEVNNFMGEREAAEDSSHSGIRGNGIFGSAPLRFSAGRSSPGSARIRSPSESCVAAGGPMGSAAIEFASGACACRRERGKMRVTETFP